MADVVKRLKAALQADYVVLEEAMPGCSRRFQPRLV